MSERYKIALSQEAKGESNEWRKCVEYKFVTAETEEELVRRIHDLLDAVVDEPETSPNPQSPAASPDSSGEPVQH